MRRRSSVNCRWVRSALVSCGTCPTSRSVFWVRESGIADAQPYAVYLSDILRSPGEVRRFAELDPARFAGVAVPNRNALDAARQLLTSAPPLSRPVTVAIAADTAAETRADRFVLPVDEPAVYDRVAARDLRRRIETDLTRVAASIETQQTRIERLEATLRELEAWRECFGGGRLEGMRQEVGRKEARIAEIGDENEALSERIDTAGNDARDCRDWASECDGQARACTERSRRAGEHHALWEARVDEWRKARLGHRQRAASAERLASREGSGTRYPRTLAGERRARNPRCPALPRLRPEAQRPRPVRLGVALGAQHGGQRLRFLQPAK